MSLMYHLVQRPDKSEGAAEDAKLYYGQVRVRQQIDFNTLCETIADRSTGLERRRTGGARRAHPRAQPAAPERELPCKWRLRKFRMSCGSRGIINKEEFILALQKGKDYLYAGSKLKNMAASPKFERIEVVKGDGTE